VTVYTSQRAGRGITRQSIQKVNAAAGQQVFRPTRNKKAADVVVTGTSKRVERRTGTRNLTAGAEGANRASGKGRVWAGYTTANSPVKRSEKVRARAHELGHTIGLEHPGSKKNPYVQHYDGVKASPSKSKSARSGLMGSGKTLNQSEVRRLRALRAQAGIDAAAARVRKRKQARGK
jgi:hypothetical protein